MKIEPADVMGVKVRLGAAQMRDRRSHPPVKGRCAHRFVKNVEPDAGQVKDPDFVPFRRPGEVLESSNPQRRHKPVVNVRKVGFTAYFGADGLPVVVVEHEAVHIA